MRYSLIHTQQGALNRTESPGQASRNIQFDLGLNGKLSVSSDLKNSFLIKFDLITADIISTGIGDSRGEWVLHRDNTPLLGDQLFAQTILTPKGIANLVAKGRINCVISGPMGSFPVKFKGEWNDLVLLE
ncbi:MAG: hypothetical protein JWR12_2989 [Mucilaginibacter sp.]|nr:hypothetical protein [Mucilaginibacter sp.]